MRDAAYGEYGQDAGDVARWGCVRGYLQRRLLSNNGGTAL